MLNDESEKDVERRCRAYFRYQPGIWLEILRRTTGNLRQDSRDLKTKREC
jgi:hypothetical protein